MFHLQPPAHAGCNTHTLRANGHASLRPVAARCNRPQKTRVANREPDTPTALAAIRTHLANERTFAAWVRTGLSVDAAGIAVARAAHEGTSTRWLAISLIVLGSSMIVFGGARFAKVARDL